MEMKTNESYDCNIDFVKNPYKKILINLVNII